MRRWELVWGVWIEVGGRGQEVGGWWHALKGRGHVTPHSSFLSSPSFSFLPLIVPSASPGQLMKRQQQHAIHYVLCVKVQCETNR